MKELIFYMITIGFILRLIPEDYRKYVELYAGMMFLLLITREAAKWLPF